MTRHNGASADTKATLQFSGGSTKNAFVTSFVPALRTSLRPVRCSSRPFRLHENHAWRTTLSLASATDSGQVTPIDSGQVTPIDSPRVKFPSLLPDAFRHPIDVRATRALQSFIGLEWVLRSILRTFEHTMFFENIATGVKVSAKQYPSIHAMLLEACEVLDIPVPQLYVRLNPVPNAYTLAVQGKKAFIVVHSSLIELLTPKELQAVIAHELGHLKSEHGVWVTMANLLLRLSSSALGNVLGNIVYETLNLRLLAWQRAAELTCDRAMLLVIQDKHTAMSALMKLTGGVSKYSNEMNVDEFLSQADQFDDASKTRFGRLLSQSMTAATTHPLPILRVRELKRWSESNQFRSLVLSGKPLESSPSA